MTFGHLDFLNSSHFVLLLDGITCEAIEGASRSSKAIDKRVIIIRDKNVVIVRFCDKNEAFILFYSPLLIATLLYQ